MAVKFKKLAEQVVVITGASSGIGLSTAEAAAARGATLVLLARSARALQELAERLQQQGAQVLPITCDVAQAAEVEAAAAAAIGRFGRIDTWVNNAGQGMYGRLDETDVDDARRLFDVNFWGVVYGSLAALPHLREQGGALINVGSEVSDAYAPLLGMYTATKHAVKGFTDVLRVEVEDIDKAPVAITLIQPTAVDTPFPQHARNYMAQEPKLPSPMIEPKQVADAILHAAETPTRHSVVGFKAKLSTVIATVLPSVGDKMAAGQASQQQYDEPPRHPEGTLYQPSEAIGVAGRTHGTGGREP